VLERHDSLPKLVEGLGNEPLRRDSQELPG